MQQIIEDLMKLDGKELDIIDDREKHNILEFNFFSNQICISTEDMSYFNVKTIRYNIEALFLEILGEDCFLIGCIFDISLIDGISDFATITPIWIKKESE